MSTPLSADEFKAKLLKAKSEEEQILNDRILELYEFTRTQVASAISLGKTSIYVGLDRRFSSDERRAAKYSINKKLAADSEFTNGMPKDLLKFLEETFTEEKMKANFLPMSNVTIFGEGCGAGIQKGGGNYSKTKTFVMFDVAVVDKLGFTWWMEPEDVKRMASTLGVQYVPELGTMSKDQIVKLAKEGFDSVLAKDNTGVDNHRSEGIIAKTVPGLLMRNGKRLMFKLKEEDFLK